MLVLTHGLRISDIIKLRVADVREPNGAMRPYISIIKKKTSKAKKFPIYNGLLSSLSEYTQNMEQGDYLFKSQKSKIRPITSVQAYRILNETARAIGLEDIGTHSMRKSFGYHHYQQNKDVALLQTIFNHSSPSITLKYIRDKSRPN